MRRRTVLALGGSAAFAATAALTTALAVGGPAAANAAPRPATTTEHVTTLHEKWVGKAVDRGPLLIQAENGYQGKAQVSADVVDCQFGRVAASCQVTIAIKPGLLYGHFTETSDGKVSGTIGGGTGVLKHASGTIKGSIVKGGGTVTLTYRA